MLSDCKHIVLYYFEVNICNEYKYMCTGVTKGTFRGDFYCYKAASIKLCKIFQKKIYLNLLTNIVYYVYIDLYIHIYIPNQAIRVAMLCFYCFFL